MSNSFVPADILFPQGAELEKWSVIACDQFTSQPEYWAETENIVKDAPSTLNMILPEAWLNRMDSAERAESVRKKMNRCLNSGIFRTLEHSFVYVERTLMNGSIRKGLIGAVDLEAYDYTAGSVTDIRASEKTVVSRIPPRMQIRRGAPIEFPHIILLCDDDGKQLIEPVEAKKDTFEKLYSFELMQGGGKVEGWLVPQEEVSAFEERLTVYTNGIEEKYADLKGVPMTFAVGDGNHSLATAKACYEELKKNHPEMNAKNSLARYALVELENIHDAAQSFEPIHRIVTCENPEELLEELKEKCCAQEGYPLTWITKDGSGSVKLSFEKSPLAVGVLQSFLDEYSRDHKTEIDYIHGEEALKALAEKENTIGFLLPVMEKGQLFRGVIADGSLPRKTFSMGHAQEKRYYLEGRKIF